jgi:hypothetical protein
MRYLRFPSKSNLADDRPRAIGSSIRNLAGQVRAKTCMLGGIREGGRYLSSTFDRVRISDQKTLGCR